MHDPAGFSSACMQHSLKMGSRQHTMCSHVRWHFLLDAQQMHGLMQVIGASVPMVFWSHFCMQQHVFCVIRTCLQCRIKRSVMMILHADPDAVVNTNYAAAYCHA